MKKSIAFDRVFDRVLEKRETSALKARARDSRANWDWALKAIKWRRSMQNMCVVKLDRKVTFLDSRYSYITSIGSLTYSSTLGFIFGVEIHGRGLAEGPAQIFWGMLELNYNTENVGFMSMKYLDNVSDRIKLIFIVFCAVHFLNKIYWIFFCSKPVKDFSPLDLVSQTSNINWSYFKIHF